MIFALFKFVFQEYTEHSNYHPMPKNSKHALFVFNHGKNSIHFTVESSSRNIQKFCCIADVVLSFINLEKIQNYFIRNS